MQMILLLSMSLLSTSRDHTIVITEHFTTKWRLRSSYLPSWQEPGSPGTEHQATMTTQPCQTGSVFQDPQHIEHGKPSVIKSYCEQIGNHGKECIWLCMQRGRKWIAKDIKLEIENQPLGIYELRKQCGWWKRHSMFSVVGVKEIKVYTDF
jgi:hypothetical protein